MNQPGRVVVGLWTLAIALLFGDCGHASCQETRCGAGKDLVVQALERVSPQSDRSALEDALQLLKHAVSACGELGDAWYYRSLVEQKLGHDSLARYALDKARFLGSEAMQQESNPLLLSTPASRGITVEADSTHSSSVVPVKPGPVQQKWALVIGISRFTDGKVPSLRYTTADANAFAAELKDPTIGRFPAAHVHVLTDEQATTKNIKEALNWIARRAKANDIVVIYVATHGTPRTLDSAGGANYLVTYDTEIYTTGAFDEDAMYATAYPMVELADAVATRMRALRTAVILDTCYSGGSIQQDAGGAALRDKPPSAEMLDRMSQGTGRIVMTASRANEESLESAELKHGYFTYYLLEALKRGNGATPLSQVYASVSQQVAQRVAASGMRQHPVLSRSSEEADFALGVEGASPADVQP